MTKLPGLLQWFQRIFFALINPSSGRLSPDEAVLDHLGPTIFCGTRVTLFLEIERRVIIPNLCGFH